MHLLRAAHHGGRSAGEGGRQADQGRRSETGVRPVLPGDGARLRRPERPGESGCASRAIPAWIEAPRGARHAAQNHLSRTAVPRMSVATDRRITDDLLRPVMTISVGFWVTVAILGAIVATGLGTWVYQMYYGFGV